MPQSYFNAGVRELERIIADHRLRDDDVKAKVKRLLDGVERATLHERDQEKTLAGLVREWQDWLDRQIALRGTLNSLKLVELRRAMLCMEVLRSYRSYSIPHRPFPWDRSESPVLGQQLPDIVKRRFEQQLPSPFPGTLPPAAPAEPQFESRYLNGRAPVAVRANELFSVHARIDTRAVGDLSTALAPIAIAESGLTVSLAALVDADSTLEAVGPTRIDIVVLPGVDSEEVAFSFKAASLGKVEITLQAFAGQLYLGDLPVAIDVVKTAAAGEQTLSKGMTAGSSPVTDATLKITYERHANRFRYELRGEGKIGLHDYEIALDQTPAEIVQALMKRLNALAKNTAALSDSLLELSLTGIGTELWRTLLPADLQAKLEGHWDDIHRLTFLAREDLVPWELLYCPKRRAFLADRWLVCRWRLGDSAPRTLARGPALYVVPNNAPTSAEEEVKGLRQILPSEAPCRKLEDLIAALAAAQFGVLHVAAHNAVKPQAASETQLLLDKPFELTMLAPFEDSFENAPVIFLNACSSAAEAEHWVGSDGWAGKFLNVGAGAFIGSMWEIRDRSAAQFAKTFYENATSGKGLGESFRLARATIDRQGDPTRFAYTFFGNPDARFSTAQGGNA